MLIWVGIPVTAGTSVWPTQSWAELRARHTGDPRDHDPAGLAHEIERVVEIMKNYDTSWYTRYIELPLGHKPLPVLDEPAELLHDPASAGQHPVHRGTIDRERVDRGGTAIRHHPGHEEGGHPGQPQLGQ